MRSANMQVLTGQLEEEYPGVTIYGIGDRAHQLEVSGHNEDDTPGVRAEDQDPDSIPEHRALDVMRSNAFTHENAIVLTQDLTQRPENQRRLLYVIYNRQIWSRSWNWVVRPYTGSNPHTDHVHLSGEADDDANTSPWTLTKGTGMSDYSAANDPHAWTGLWRLDALTYGRDIVLDGPMKGEPMWLVQTLKRIEAKLDALKLGGVDISALAEATRPVTEEVVQSAFRRGGTAS